MTGSEQDLGALIAELEEQERRLLFARFDNDDAWRLGSLVVALAQERELPVTVDIRRHGHQLFHAALPGTAPDNDEWINRKVRVVNRFNAASYLVGRRLLAQGRTLDADAGVEPADYAAHGGSFPIRVRDVGVVGTVTVSGLPQGDDHALVVEALERFLAG
ncbi:heme-degrading domain-containing protein [Asanoa sp. NPDC050611]|uniref:heme-degrading domain-containing protein n=1 Tax=Asanoa sp. NPDC050611 TaxID=3157098 RepID=UPI0033E61874